MNKPTNKTFIDITGMTFGKLTVLEYAGALQPDHPRNKKHTWLCRCECGVEKIFWGVSLRSGGSQSCGCARLENIKKRFIDLTGEKFGKLTVKNYVDTRHGHTYWLCKCECGNEKEISSQSLKNKLTISCGCYQKVACLTHGLWGKPGYKKLRHQDPFIKLRDSVGNSVRDALNDRKLGKTFDYLPYTLEELKSHLENQFEPWMSWDNFGGAADDPRETWWIDHIKPHSSFPYKSLEDPLFKECWSLSNLRPLEKIANMKKGIKCIYSS